jgi:glycosyltransferase involved in cell wall biosynthesis
MELRNKILLATSWVYPHIGGVSSHIKLLAQMLDLKEASVLNHQQIISHNSGRCRSLVNRLQRKLRKKLRIETISLHAKQMANIIMEKDFEIIHCHDAMATWAAIRARDQSGRKFKIVTTVHGPVSRHMVEEGQLFDSVEVRKVAMCEQEAWKRCDAIIAVDTTQAKICTQQGAPLEKIIIIPNAVDLSKIDVLAGSIPIKKGDNRLWVLVPRRLSPKNGIEYAIRAMAILKVHPRLFLAGDGLDMSRLERLCSDLNLSNDVFFLGGLKHEVLLPLMHAVDVVLIPSVPIHGIEEATSIAAIEAMALRRPVIASEIGGLKELLVNDENGILVPPGDPSAIAKSLNGLLSDTDFASSLGKAARKTVEEKFSSKIWYQKHVYVYDELL